MIPIVDPHVHIWDLETRLYPRREKRRAEGDTNAVSYLLSHLLADAAGISLAKAIHVEAFPTDGMAEVRHVSEMADEGPSGLPQGIVAHADLSHPRIEDALSALAAFPRVRGIRQALYIYRDGPTRDFAGDKAWEAGFARLARHGLSFDMQISPEQMPAAARLAAAHPDTRIALNHFGLAPDRSLPTWRAWKAGLRLLAANGNVWIKMSGLAMFDRSWTIESLRPYVYEVLDVFGTGRAMFASNFPVDRPSSSYADLWRAFAKVTGDLGADEQALLLGGNAERFYRV